MAYRRRVIQERSEIIVSGVEWVRRLDESLGRETSTRL